METPVQSPGPLAERPRKTIVVFGASWCVDGSELYAKSVTLGTEVASAGFKLVNGGYGGTMEGTARGAASVPGSIREGVVVPALFPHRSGLGNAFLTEVTPTATLLERIQSMVSQSDYFIVMPGTLGTLTEAAIVWNIAALGAIGGYRSPLIFCYREPWEKALVAVADALNLPAEHRSHIRFVDTGSEAVAAIAADYTARTDAASASS